MLVYNPLKGNTVSEKIYYRTQYIMALENRANDREPLELFHTFRMKEISINIHISKINYTLNELWFIIHNSNFGYFILNVRFDKECKA